MSYYGSLSILHEGQMDGVIAALKYIRPNITNLEIKRQAKVILQWKKEKFDYYWCDWHGLNAEI